MNKSHSSILLVAIIVICILSGVEVDLFIPSLPEISEIYSLTPFMVQLLLSVNFVAYCVCLLFAGALGDRYNRRVIMLIGLWIFVIGSVLCVMAPSFASLVAGRFLQGVGISGPVALCFAEIVEHYPSEKQAGLLGILNGCTTIAMAFAPVLGSYVTLWFDWRANFVVLLILAVIAVALSHFALPNRKGDPSVLISPKAYLPIVQSPKVLTYAFAISFLIVPYWLFIGMSPILYMESFGVPLSKFGFYQGTLAAVFSILSFSSPKILSILGQRRCLHYGIILCAISALLLGLMAIFNPRDPLVITGILVVLSIAVLFPLNILFPLSAECIPGARGRITATVIALRLLLTAIVLQTASYFYQGDVILLASIMAISLVLSLTMMGILHRKKWIHLHS